MGALVHLEFRKLTNDETMTYVTEFTSIIHQFPTLEKSVEKVIVPLSQSLEVAANSSVKVDISNLLEKRREKNSVRASSYLAFRGIIESESQSSDMSEKAASQLLIKTIKLNEWRMQALAPDKFTARLTALLTALSDEKLKAAVALVGADKALARLVEANKLYGEADNACTLAKANLNDVSTSQALKAVHDYFSQLLTAIDGLLVTAEDPLLRGMVEQLNVLTEAKKQTLKSRATRAANEKKGKTNAPLHDPAASGDIIPE